MRTLLLLALALFFITASASSAAAEEPTGFADIAWGTARHLARGALEDLCRPHRGIVTSPMPREERCGSYVIGLAAGPITLGFTVGLSHYEFVSLTGYMHLRNAVVAKFGPPGAADTKSYSTLRGTNISGEQLSWEWPGAVAFLSERCGRIDRSCLRVYTRAEYEEQLERMKAIEEKAKKQF